MLQVKKSLRYFPNRSAEGQARELRPILRRLQTWLWIYCSRCGALPGAGNYPVSLGRLPENLTDLQPKSGWRKMESMGDAWCWRNKTKYLISFSLGGLIRSSYNIHIIRVWSSCHFVVNNQWDRCMDYKNHGMSWKGHAKDGQVVLGAHG